MQTLRRSEPDSPSAGLPLWALWAVAPVVVALGIIGGMAAATYFAPAAGTAPVQTQPSTAAQAPATAAPSSVTQPAPTGNTKPNTASVFTPPSTEVTGGMEVPPVPRSGVIPTSGNTPTGVPRAVAGLSDAKAELDQYFGYYTDGGATISNVDYQLLTNTGYSTSLVGMISVSDYAGWAAALQNNPQHLKAWLETAAARIRPALESERVFLAWAVLEVRRDRPAGFTDGEVKLLKDGTYLVTRPLASTADPGQSTVALRPAASFAAGAAGTAGPWMTYGPQVRFDSTDKYRPVGSDGR